MADGRGKGPKKVSRYYAGHFLLTVLSVLLLTSLPACSSDQTRDRKSGAPQVRSSGPVSHYSPLWTNYRINTGVHAMAFEGHELWVGTEQGVLLYDLRDEKIIRKYDTKNGLLSNDVTTIEIDSRGNKWIGTHGGGLVLVGGGEEGKIKKIYNAPVISDPFVYKTLFDREGKLWVATWKGADYFDGKVWKKYTKENGLVDDWVYSLGIDQEGKVWFGTEGGVNAFDGKNWETYTHRNGLGADQKEIPDFERIVNPSRHHASTPGKEAEGYNPNYVLSLAIDRKGTKWFGTWGAGLSRFDGKEWTSFTVKQGLPGNFIADISIDSDNGLWIATEGGIGYFDGSRWTRYSRTDGLIDDSVFVIARDLNGSKWFGTLDGISKLEGMVPSL